MAHDKELSRKPNDEGRQRGSALILSIFVLGILASMGVALMFVSDGEMKMSQANLRTSKMFFLAEAGLEDGRMNLFAINGNGDFSDDLAAAAGANGVVDFDLATITPSYDPNGNFTGFTGYGDDEPIKVHTCSVSNSFICTSDADCPGGEICNKSSKTFGDGFYNVFLSNDSVDNLAVPPSPLVDTNERVLLTAIGASDDRSVEVAQAIIIQNNILPTVPPATITLLGPTPDFKSGTSNVKDYVGDDCGGTGGIPGLYVPVVGAIGPAAEASVESGVEKNPDFVTGPYSDPTDTIADLTDPTEPTVAGSGYGTIDPQWQDCSHIQQVLEDLREEADMYCTGSLHCDPTTPCTNCDPTQTSADSITFIDGDYRVSGNLTGRGTLVVTGTLEISGNTDWDGLILVMGEGEYYLDGGGSGEVKGGVIVADIAGPDNTFSGTCDTGGGGLCWYDADCPAGKCTNGAADNCTGGTNGFDSPTYDESGGGNSGNIYCTESLKHANPVKPYKVVKFKQW